jgi:hypothetical protein
VEIADIFGGQAEVTGAGVAAALGKGSVGELLKSMSVGATFPAQIGDLNPGQLMATVPQDLDDVLHNMSFDPRKHTFLFRETHHDKVWSTVHQYVRKQSQGSLGRRFMFHQEGGLPPESDSTYTLEQVAMKFAGSVRRLPIQARLVKSIAGNTVKAQNKDGAEEILAGIEWAMLYGNPTVNPMTFEGIKQSMIREGISLDAGGIAPTEALIDEGMERITERPNWGYPTDILCSPRMHKTIRQVYAPRMRSMLGKAFHPNYSLKGMTFDHCAEGDEVRIRKHPLAIEEAPVCDELGAGPDPSKRPVLPIVISQPTPANDADSLYGNGQAARAGGVVKYRAVAINEYGMSVPLTLNDANIGAGQSAPFTIKDGAVPGALNRATGFIIYRTEPGLLAPTATQIDEISAASGANVTYTDRAENLPGCSDLFLLSNNREALCWKQLLPFFNFPLGNLDTSYRWALLLFGALKIALPRHHAVIRNVKPDLALRQVFGPGDQSSAQANL